MQFVQRFAKFQARKLGDRVPLSSALQRATEQGLLTDRLLGIFPGHRAASQKQPPPHPGSQHSFDQIRLDLDVLKHEDRMRSVVGVDAAHLRRGEHHHRGLVLAEPPRAGAR